MPHHCSTSMIKLPWPIQKEQFGSHPSHYPNAPFRIFYLKFAKMLVLKRGTRHTASAPQLFNTHYCVNDSGWEARHIMFLSGHRNESSLRSYSRTVSTSQKRALSTTLSSLKTQTSSATMCDAQHAVVPRPAIQNELIPVETTTATSVSSQMSYQLSMQSVTQTPGFFASSTFTNCNFHFK